MATVLDAAGIKAKASEVFVEPITVPQWGDAVVYFKPLTPLERDAWYNEVEGAQTGPIRTLPVGGRCRQIVRSMCDEQGQRLFGDDELGVLDNDQSGAVEYLWQEFCRVNGIGDDEEDEAEKN